VCSGVIALLQRLGLTASQGAVTARQKSAEGIVLDCKRHCSEEGRNETRKYAPVRPRYVRSVLPSLSHKVVNRQRRLTGKLAWTSVRCDRSFNTRLEPPSALKRTLAGVGAGSPIQNHFHVIPSLMLIANFLPS